MLLAGLLGLAVALERAGHIPAAEEASEDVVRAVVALLADEDKDVRALGLQQVREAAKGPAATKRFVAVLPTLAPEAQAGLLDALGERCDRTARPAVLEMLKSRDMQVRAAATRALGPLGQASDAAVLASLLAASAGGEKTAARSSLVRLSGPTVNAAIAAALKEVPPGARAELIEVLVTRRAKDSVPSFLAAAEDPDAAVRAAALAALGQLAGPEHVANLVQLVLKAPKGPRRDAVEKTVMFVCARTADPDKRAGPVLAAVARLDAEQQTVLLPTLGRVGGQPALKIIEEAIADPRRREAGVQALCNWPDASVAPRLLDLAQTAGSPQHRAMALAALIRVAPLPDKRPDAQKLGLLRQAMTLATRDEERNLVLRRARAIRAIETLRFVAPYMDQPAFAQQACETVVELAHHRGLREPNKAEFDRALDAVIRISKDDVVIDRAKRYKKGQTWHAPETKPSGDGGS